MLEAQIEEELAGSAGGAETDRCRDPGDDLEPARKAEREANPRAREKLPLAENPPAPGILFGPPPDRLEEDVQARPDEPHRARPQPTTALAHALARFVSAAGNHERREVSVEDETPPRGPARGKPRLEPEAARTTTVPLVSGRKQQRDPRRDGEP